MACNHFNNSPASYLYGLFGSCFFGIQVEIGSKTNGNDYQEG